MLLTLSYIESTQEDELGKRDRTKIKRKNGKQAHQGQRQGPKRKGGLDSDDDDTCRCRGKTCRCSTLNATDLFCCLLIRLTEAGKKEGWIWNFTNKSSWTTEEMDKWSEEGS